MKMHTVVLFLILIGLNLACSKKSNDFEMTVDRVDELKGFILKGISITGKVKAGCIANDDEFVVERSGKEVYRTITRIVNVADLKDLESFTGKVFQGDYVTFYIPDGKLEEIKVGDRVVSNTISCKAEDPKNTKASPQKPNE